MVQGNGCRAEGSNWVLEEGGAEEGLEEGGLEEGVLASPLLPILLLPPRQIPWPSSQPANTSVGYWPR
jgi:hypothetical protein